MSNWSRLYDVSKAIAFVPAEQEEGSSALTDAVLDRVQDILRQHRVTRADFLALDEQPGVYSDTDLKVSSGGVLMEWHFKLRQLRNRRGSELFAMLAENEQ